MQRNLTITCSSRGLNDGRFVFLSLYDSKIQTCLTLLVTVVSEVAISGLLATGLLTTGSYVPGQRVGGEGWPLSLANVHNCFSLPVVRFSHS